jgi:hypothetical protein
LFQTGNTTWSKYLEQDSVQGARDAGKRVLDSEQAAAEAAEAKAQELVDAGKGSVVAVQTETAKTFARAEKEYYELEAQFKEQLGLVSAHEGG